MGRGFSHADGWADAPPISLLSCQKRNGPCTVQREKRWRAPDRGTLFIAPGTDVYAGMIVGQCNRNEDMSVNVCKRKQLTNMRAAGSDEAIRLAPPKVLSLEQSMEYLADDELLEVTPKSLRMRKRILDHSARMRAASKAKS